MRRGVTFTFSLCSYCTCSRSNLRGAAPEIKAHLHSQVHKMHSNMRVEQGTNTVRVRGSNPTGSASAEHISSSDYMSLKSLNSPEDNRGYDLFLLFITFFYCCCWFFILYVKQTISFRISELSLKEDLWGLVLSHYQNMWYESRSARLSVRRCRERKGDINEWKRSVVILNLRCFIINWCQRGEGKEEHF